VGTRYVKINTKEKVLFMNGQQTLSCAAF
jgi:hypothetical protein